MTEHFHQVQKRGERNFQVRSPFEELGTREPIMTCLKIKKNIYRSTSPCSKICRHEVSSELAFLENSTPRNGNPNTVTAENSSRGLSRAI